MTDAPHADARPFVFCLGPSGGAWQARIHAALKTIGLTPSAPRPGTVPHASLDPQTYSTGDGPSALHGPSAIVRCFGRPRPARDGVPSQEAGQALIHAYWRQHGLDLSQHLVGAYSCIVFDEASGSLHAIADPTGRHALFWTQAGSQITVSNSLRALTAMPWVRREADPEQIAEYLSFGVVHAPNTLLPDIQQVPAGHRMRFSKGAVSTYAWHTPSFPTPMGSTPPDENALIVQLQLALDHSVERMTRGRNPAGLYLSGGIGSATILTAARKAGRRLQTFNVALDDDLHPESPFAGRIARLMGATHHTVRVRSTELVDAFDGAVTAMEQPVAHPSVVLQLLLAQTAATEVQTVLTGDGADDLFGSRLHAHATQLIHRSQRAHGMPRFLHKLGRLAAPRLGRTGHRLVPPQEIGPRLGLGGRQLFEAPQIQDLMLDTVLARPERRQEVLARYYANVHTDPHNAMLHASWCSRLVHDVVPRVERTAYRAGLDIRLPLLDAAVVQKAQRIPGNMKLQRGLLPNRRLLRVALTGSLPAPLIERPDRTMPAPLDAWLTGRGQLFFEDRYQRLKNDPLGLFHTRGLDSLRASIGRVPGAASRMWALIILDTWLQQVGITGPAQDG